MAVNFATKPLGELIHELSPELRMEVRHFVEFLLSRHAAHPVKKLRQDWANAVQAQTYSSVELQHLAMKWREESCTS